MKDKFRYNKKRKHYSYIFKIKNGYCSNILLTTQSESTHRKHGKAKIKRNIKLYRHPNSRKTNVIVFIYNHPPYVDAVESFDIKKIDWKWNVNDKRKVKRMKKYKNIENTLKANKKSAMNSSLGQVYLTDANI